MKNTIVPAQLQFFLCIILISLPGCTHRKQIDKQKLHLDLPIPTQIAAVSENPPSITIWVHGTVMFRKPSYHHIFNNKACLLPITSLPSDHHFRLLTSAIAEHDPAQFPLEEFYVFGWSGKIHNQERKDAALALLYEILLLRNRYREKYGCDPIIRIIAHSHGGNVVLNMAKLKVIHEPFKIQSLILLACPVQEKTKHLISNPLFERVYSLYSSLDLIQILAPQVKRACTLKCLTTKHKHCRIPLFSSRLFPAYSHLTQAKIKINDFPISHTHFSTKEFTTMLPTILQRLDSWHRESLTAHTMCKHKLLCIYHKRK